ncbi:MAG: hypothetical protein WAV84_08350 [Bacteroidota bacterium]
MTQVIVSGICGGAATRDRIFLFAMLPDTGGIGTNRGFSIVQLDTLRRELWRKDTMFAQGVAITHTATYADERGNMYVSGTIEGAEKDVFFVFRVATSGVLQWQMPIDRKFFFTSMAVGPEK